MGAAVGGRDPTVGAGSAWSQDHVIMKAGKRGLEFEVTGGVAVVG
jgi:hypothetical protein